MSTPPARDVDVRGSLTIALLVLGSLMIGAGLGWWVHLGLGIATMGAAWFYIGILIGRD